MDAARLRAIIFDFNGVIADDETPHLLSFQQALQEDGLTLTKENYYGAYLGMDERNCATALVESVTGTGDPVRIGRILERKAALFTDYTATHKPQLFPGVVKLVKRAGERYRLAITMRRMSAASWRMPAVLTNCCSAPRVMYAPPAF